jgi:chromosome segregation ATPase
LQGWVNEAQRREHEVREIRGELERLRGKLREAKPQARQLAALLTESAQLQDEVRGLKAELAAQTAEVGRLAEALALAQVEGEASTRLKERREALERQQTESAEQLESLHAEPLEREARLVEVMARREQAEDEAERARGEAVVLHEARLEEIVWLRQEALEAERQREELVERLAEAGRDAERLRTALEERGERLAEEIARREEAIRRADHLREELSRGEARRDEVEERLASAFDEIARLGDARAEAERAWREAVEQLQTRAEEVDLAYRDEVSRIRSDVLEREQRLEEMSARLAEQEREAEGLRAGREEAERRLAKVIARSQTLEQECKRLEADCLELQPRLAETTAQLEALREGQTRVLDEFRPQWEAGRTDPYEEIARGWQELSNQVETARRETVTACRDRDEARQRAEDLERERDALTSRLAEQEQVRLAAVRNPQDEVESLRRTVAQARQAVDAATARTEAHAHRIVALEDDRRRQRLGREQERREHEERIAVLRNQLEAALAEAQWPYEASADLKARPTQASNQAQAVTGKPGRSEAGLDVARDQLALNSHDLVLSQFYADGPAASRAPGEAAGADELALSRRRSEELSGILQASERANQALTKILSKLGVRTNGTNSGRKPPSSKVG